MDDFSFESSDSDGGEYGAIMSEVVVVVVVLVPQDDDNDDETRDGRVTNTDDDDEPTHQEAARGLEAGILNASIDVSRAGRIQMTHIIMAQFVRGILGGMIWDIGTS